MRGVFCCLVSILAFSCVQSEAKRDSVIRIYRSDRVSETTTLPNSDLPHQQYPITSALLSIDQDDKVELTLESDQGSTKTQLVVFNGQLSFTRQPVSCAVVLQKLGAAKYRGSHTGFVWQIHTAFIQFEGNHPSRVVVMSECVADFDVQDSLTKWDMDDDTTREIAEWFRKFDDIGMSRQRTVIQF